LANHPEATICPYCAASLVDDPVRESWLDRPLFETFGRVGFPSGHRILKQLLGLWAIAYPILDPPAAGLNGDG
jgi:hypothetical protein